MATQFAGGTYVNTTITSDGTINTMITAMQTQLTTAGWTVSSGGGTNNVLMKSAASAYPLQIQMRFKNNSGTSMQISLADTTNTYLGGNTTTNGIHIYPNTTGTIFRILATQYWFCLMQTSVYATARTFAYGGIIYVPSFITGVTNAAILIGNSLTDASATLPNSWRQYPCITQNTAPNFQVLWNTSLWDNANNEWNSIGYAGCPQLMCTCVTAFGTGGTLVSSLPFGCRWASGADLTFDGYITWGQTTGTDEPMIRGQLYDSLGILDPYNGDTTSTFGSHTWYNIMNNWAGSAASSPRFSFWLATS